MPAYLDIVVMGLAWACLVLGALLCVIGGIGINRFPDVYSRLHPAGVIDTGGVFFIIAGLLLRTPDLLTQVKLLILLGFIFFTAPTATHAVAKAAQTGRIAPWRTANSSKTGE